MIYKFGTPPSIERFVAKVGACGRYMTRDVVARRVDLKLPASYGDPKL
jgi:hypothetical protein